MKKVIRDSDYTITIVNDNYLKSFNCLFEIVTTMNDPQWMQRVFPIVLPGTAISSDAAILVYQEYWTKEAEKLERIGSNPADVEIAKDGARKIGPYLRFVNQVQPAPLDTQVQSEFQETLASCLLDKKN